MRSRSKPGWQQALARERIAILFSLAGKAFAEKPDRAHRYVSLARKIAMRYTVTLSSQDKRRFCKHCYHFLCSGVNARSRTREGRVVISCLDCGKVSRFPLSKKFK